MKKSVQNWLFWLLFEAELYGQMAVGYFWKERTFCNKRNFLAAAPTEAANASVTLNGFEKHVCSRHDIDAIIMSLRIIVPSKSNRLNLAPLSSKKSILLI